MQVAAKVSTEGQTLDADVVAANYDTLVALHERYGIDADQGSNNNFKSNKQPAPQGITFIFQDILFEDFRTLKADGTVKDTFPDFRTADGREVPGLTNDRGSVWMFTRDNEAKPEVAELVAAADAAAVFA